MQVLKKLPTYKCLAELMFLVPSIPPPEHQIDSRHRTEPEEYHFVSPHGGLLQSVPLPGSGPCGNCPDKRSNSSPRRQFLVPSQRPPESLGLRPLLQHGLRPFGSGVRSNTAAPSRRPIRGESFLNRSPVPRALPH